MLVCLLGLRGGDWLGNVWHNAGLLGLNRALRTVSAESLDTHSLSLALVALQHARSARPGSPLTQRALSLAYTLDDESAEARAAWEQAGAYPADSLLQGQIAARQNRPDAALAWYALATRFPATRAQGWYQIGQMDIERSDWEAARAALTRAWDADHALAAKALATVLLDQGDYAAAEHVLQITLTTVPTSYHRLWWRRALSQSLVSQQKWQEAVAACQAALQEFPAEPHLYVDLGWVYYEQNGDMEAALTQFQQAITVAPARGIGEFETGQLLRRERRYAEADGWYQQALTKNPYPYWFLARASLARVMQNTGLAQQIAQEAARLYPDYAPIYYELADSYWRQGEWAAARQALATYTQHLGAPNAAFFVLSGQIAEAEGAIADALTAYRQALALQPDQAVARAALKRLSSPTETQPAGSPPP